MVAYGSLAITDGIFGMRFLFMDGEAPPAPFRVCGQDPTADSLGCDTSAQCEGQADLCLEQETLEGLVGELPGFSFCLPAGLPAIARFHHPGGGDQVNGLRRSATDGEGR